MPATARPLQAPTKSSSNKHKMSSHIPLSMKSRTTKSSRVRAVPNFAKLHEKWTHKLEISKACTKKPCTLVQEFDLTAAGTKFSRPATRDVSQLSNNAKPCRRIWADNHDRTSPRKASIPPNIQREGGDFKADPTALQSILDNTGVSAPNVMGPPTLVTRHTLAGGALRTPRRVTTNATVQEFDLTAAGTKFPRPATSDVSHLSNNLKPCRNIQKEAGGDFKADPTALQSILDNTGVSATSVMGPPTLVTRQTLAGGTLRNPRRVTTNDTELRSRGVSLISLPDSRLSMARPSAVGLFPRRVAPPRQSTTTLTPTRVAAQQPTPLTPSRVAASRQSTTLTPRRVCREVQEVSEPRVSMARPSAVGLSARRMPQRQSTTPNRARPQTQVKPVKWKEILSGNSPTDETDMVRTKLDFEFTAPASAPPRGAQPRRVLKVSTDKENNPSFKEPHSPKLGKQLQMSPKLRSNTPTKQQRALQSLSPNVPSPSRKPLFSPHSQDHPGSPGERKHADLRSEQTVLNIMAQLDKENTSPLHCLSPGKKRLDKVDENGSPVLSRCKKSSFLKKQPGSEKKQKSRHVEFKLAEDLDCSVEELNETLNESLLEYESLQSAAAKMQTGEGAQQAELLKQLQLIQEKQQQLQQLQAMLTQKLQQQQDGSPPGACGHNSPPEELQETSPPGTVSHHSPSVDSSSHSSQEQLGQSELKRKESSPGSTELSQQTLNPSHGALQTTPSHDLTVCASSSSVVTATPTSLHVPSTCSPAAVHTPGSVCSSSSGGSAGSEGSNHWKKRMLYVKAEYVSPPPAPRMPPVLEEAPIQTPLVMRAQAGAVDTEVAGDFKRLSLDGATQDAALTLLTLNTPVDHTPRRSRFHSAPAASPYLPRLSDISPEPFRDESSLQQRPHYYDIQEERSAVSDSPLTPADSSVSINPVCYSTASLSPSDSSVLASPAPSVQPSPQSGRQGSLSLTGNCPAPPPPASSRYFWTPALEKQPHTVPTNVAPAPVAMLAGRFFDTPCLVASWQSSQNAAPSSAIASDAAVASSPGSEDSFSLAGHCAALPSRVAQLSGRLLSTPTVSTPTVTCSRRQSSVSSVSLSSSTSTSPSPARDTSQLVPAALRFHEALLDEEVSLYACRLHSPRLGTPEDCRCPDPITSTLATGDDMHFVPIHCESPEEVVTEKLQGSAFGIYKGSLS